MYIYDDDFEKKIDDISCIYLFLSLNVFHPIISILLIFVFKFLD